MNKTKRARKAGPLTANGFAEYMTIKTLEHLAKMAPQERAARLEAFHRGVAESRAKLGRAPRTRVSQAPSRDR
jgi:hypothetical protein